MKKTTKLTALLTAAGIAAGIALAPMGVSAEPTPEPGSVPIEYAETRLDMAVVILEHYAQTAVGLAPIFTDNFGICAADTNADGKIDLSDASAYLTYYAMNAAGIPMYMETVADIFTAWHTANDALAAYQPIAEQFLKDAANTNEGGAYSIVQLDNDFIPELVLSPDTSHYAGACTIYTYVDGEVVLLGENCFGSMGYIQYTHTNDPQWHGTGYIITEDGYTGYCWATVQYLYRGELTTVHELVMDYNTNEFSIDGVPSTEAECRAFIDSFDADPIGRDFTSISNYGSTWRWW